MEIIKKWFLKNEKTACILLVTALLLSFCLSSCRSNEYEFYRSTIGDDEYVLCIDVDPFETRPGEAKACNLYKYTNGERGRSAPAKVVASDSAEIPYSQKDEDGVSYTIWCDDLGWVKYRYDFEKNPGWFRKPAGSGFAASFFIFRGIYPTRSLRALSWH